MTQYDNVFPEVKKFLDENPNANAKSIVHALSSKFPNIKNNSLTTYVYKAIKQFSGATTRKPRVVANSKTAIATDLISKFVNGNTSISMKDALTVLANYFKDDPTTNITPLAYTAIKKLNLKIDGGRNSKHMRSLTANNAAPIQVKSTNNESKLSNPVENSTVSPAVEIKVSDPVMVISKTPESEPDPIDIDDIPEFVLKTMGYSSKEEARRDMENWDK